MLDNVIWFANVGMLTEQVFDKISWRKKKDQFCLVKNYLDALRAIILMRSRLQKQREIEKEIE